MTDHQQGDAPRAAAGTGSDPTSGDSGPAPTYAADPEAQAFASAAAVMGQRAPGKATVSPIVVIIEGAVLAILGASLWLMPDLSSTLALQAIAVVLLVTAALGAWRVLRDQIAPVRVGPVAFRAGVGSAVGLIVIIGSIIADDRETTTLAVAIILGIGLVLYGLSSLVAALFKRESGSRLPVVALAISAAALVVGALLVWRADQGIDELQAVFVWLGILLLVLGIAIVGWGLMLRSREQEEAAE